MGILLTGCGEETNTKDGIKNASPAAVEVKINKGEGYYQSEDSSVSVYIHEITDDHVILTYADAMLQPLFIKAEKNKRGEYVFSLTDKQIEERSFGLLASSYLYSSHLSPQEAPSESLPRIYEVSFRLKDEKMWVNAKGDSVFESYYKLFVGVQELEREKDNSNGICDFTKCLDAYQEVYENIYAKDMTIIEIGKDRESKEISYVEASFERVWDCWNEKTIKEIQLYQIGEINFLSTKEECDKILGEPLRETDTGWEYSYRDGYVIEISFGEDHISKMGIYKESRESATKEYIVGDFILRGCRIVDGTKCYKKGGVVKFPEEAVAIAPRAFSVGNVSKGKKIKIEIPRDIHLEPEAFSELGSVEVTFETGRKVIESRAFMNAAIYEKEEITIIVPTSVKKIESYAFAQEYDVAAKFQLHLPKGLKDIDETALEGLGKKHKIQY